MHISKLISDTMASQNAAAAKADTADAAKADAADEKPSDPQDDSGETDES
jgi:hypothetical protein